MKSKIKFFSLLIILMYCLSPLVAADLNDTNCSDVVEQNMDDSAIANFDVYVDPCCYGSDVQVHIDTDYNHPMNVSLVLYNAAGYPIFTEHNIDISSHSDTIIPSQILFYKGDYKLKAIFECENNTIEKTIPIHIE